MEREKNEEEEWLWQTQLSHPLRGSTWQQASDWQRGGGLEGGSFGWAVNMLVWGNVLVHRALRCSNTLGVDSSFKREYSICMSQCQCFVPRSVEIQSGKGEQRSWKKTQTREKRQRNLYCPLRRLVMTCSFSFFPSRMTMKCVSTLLRVTGLSFPCHTRQTSFLLFLLAKRDNH